MYLLKDGKCVQSFKNGDFNATVEDIKGKVNSKWELAYTSTQACSSDSNAKFKLKIDGVCVPKSNNFNFSTSLTTGAMSDCEASLTYKSSGACHVKYLPLAKY